MVDKPKLGWNGLTYPWDPNLDQNFFRDPSITYQSKKQIMQNHAPHVCASLPPSSIRFQSALPGTLDHLQGLLKLMLLNTRRHDSIARNDLGTLHAGAGSGHWGLGEISIPKNVEVQPYDCLNRYRKVIYIYILYILYILYIYVNTMGWFTITASSRWLHKPVVWFWGCKGENPNHLRSRDFVMTWWVCA